MNEVYKCTVVELCRMLCRRVVVLHIPLTEVCSIVITLFGFKTLTLR